MSNCTFSGNTNTAVALFKSMDSCVIYNNNIAVVYHPSYSIKFSNNNISNNAIGVDLNAEHSHKKPENIIEVLLNAFDFTLMNATKLLTEEADLLITPDLSSFNLVDTDQLSDLIEKGYLETKKILKKL